MKIEAVFYTQIGSILSFIVTLFILYRILLKTKDATIETQKEQISLLNTKVKTLEATSYDVLLQTLEKKSSSLVKALEEATEEKERLLIKTNELEGKLTENNSENKSEMKSLKVRLNAVTQQVTSLKNKHNQLARILKESKNPYIGLLFYSNTKSPIEKELSYTEKKQRDATIILKCEVYEKIVKELQLDQNNVSLHQKEAIKSAIESSTEIQIAHALDYESGYNQMIQEALNRAKSNIKQSFP